MRRARDAFAVLAVLLALAFAGCGAVPPADRVSQRATGSTTAGATVTSTATPPPDPNEFVHLERVRNESVVSASPEGDAVHFENLGDTRRRTILRALNETRVAAEGWSFYDDSRPIYVEYEGRWYHVVVGVH